MATREIRKIYFTRAAGRTGRTREVYFPYFTLCHQVFTYYCNHFWVVVFRVWPSLHCGYMSVLVTQWTTCFLTNVVYKIFSKNLTSITVLSFKALSTRTRVAAVSVHATSAIFTRTACAFIDILITNKRVNVMQSDTLVEFRVFLFLFFSRSIFVSKSLPVSQTSPRNPWAQLQR